MQIHVVDSSFRFENIRFVTGIRDHFRGLGGPGGLGGLKLDEIDAANSFLMLPMARNGFKWPVTTI